MEMDAFCVDVDFHISCGSRLKEYGNAGRTRWRMAAGQRIANVTSVAYAQRRVVHDLALGIVAARSWTWIDALVIDAGPIRRTFAVQNTLGTALDVRIAVVLWNAGARPRTVVLLADGIRSAGCRLARMHRFGF